MSNFGLIEENMELSYSFSCTTATVSSWLSRMGLMADPSGQLYLRCSSNRKASKQVTVLSFFRLYRPSHGRLLFPAEIIDLLKGFIIGLSVYVMSYIDTSMMYHLIKSQSVIKLYLFYNMLEASTHYPLLTYSRLRNRLRTGNKRRA